MSLIVMYEDAEGPMFSTDANGCYNARRLTLFTAAFLHCLHCVLIASTKLRYGQT